MFSYYTYCVGVCMLCVLVFLCAMVNVLEDSLQGAFSFRSVGLRDQTQVVGLAAGVRSC